MRYLLSFFLALLFMGCATTTQHTALKATPNGASFYDPFDSGAATPWTFYQGSHLFTSGTLRMTSPTTNGAYAYIRTNWANLLVSTDVKLNDTIGSAAIGLRYNPTNGASYQLRLYNNGQLSIEKYNGWFSGKKLFGTSVSLQVGTTNNLKLSASNNVLVAYFNNSPVIMFADATPLTSGGIDLSMWNGNANFDNVTVYTISTSPVINPPVITSGLTNGISVQGQPYTFNVTATGSDLTYVWKTPQGTTIGTNAYTIDNLQVFDAGTYAVYVTNNVGTVSSTAYLSIGTTNILPDCIPLGQSVTLTWCPSPDTNVVAYALYYGGGVFITNWNPSIYDTNVPCGPLVSEGTNWSRIYTNILILGNTNTVTINSLTPGFTYYFAAVSLDSAGNQSSFSNEDRHTIPLYAKLTNALSSAITYVGNNTVQLYAKVCPDSRVTVLSRVNLSDSQWSAMVTSTNPSVAIFTPVNNAWTTIATNIMPDAYGNFFYTYPSTNKQQFFRIEINQ